MNILLTFYFSFLSLFLSFSTNSQKIDFKTIIETITTLSNTDPAQVQLLKAIVIFDKKELKSKSGQLTINFEMSETNFDNIIFDQSLTIPKGQKEIKIGEIDTGMIMIINDSDKNRIKAQFIRKIKPGMTYNIKANEFDQSWTGSSTLTSAKLKL